MKTQSFVLLFGFAVFVLGFQNCGQVKFDSADGQLVAKTGEGDAVVDQGDGTEPGEPVDDVTSDPGHDYAKQDEDKRRERPPAADGKKDCDEKKRAERDEESEDESEDDSRSYVCVLEGPGQSVKAAYVNEGLSEKNGTPSDICMSRVACESIVSQVMQVKGAEKRGFCPQKNPHVVALTNAQIQSLVDKVKAAQGSK